VLYIFLTLDIRGINDIRLISSPIHAPSHELEDTDTNTPLVVVVVVVVGRPRQATGVLQPVGLLYRPLWTFQLFATRCPRAYRRVPHSSGGSWNYERE
jgi:hypothetical protein